MGNLAWEEEKRVGVGLLAVEVPWHPLASPGVPRHSSARIKQEGPFPPQLIKTPGPETDNAGCSAISLADEAPAPALFPL